MTQFTTIAGLKSRAKRMKKDLGIQHAEALNRVAREGGYQNYQHAHRALCSEQAAGDDA